MKKLLNTLYISTPDYYLSLDGENIVVLLDVFLHQGIILNY